MKSFNTSFKTKEELQSFIYKKKIPNNSQTLVQVFCGIPEEKKIQEIQKCFQSILPQAILIGTTTAGEIFENGFQDKSIIISFSVFEKSTLKLGYTKLQSSSFSTGDILAKQLKQENNKVFIIFSEGLQTNGEEFLKGVFNTAPQMYVAGGMAGDNAKFQNTFVFTNTEILESGAVAVSIASKNLLVHNYYHFDWANIGKHMTVTKSIKNRVYEIDHMPVVEVYKKYLGPEIVNILPSVEFPLILNRNGILIARDVLKKHEDGSLSLGGNIHEGEKVQFGYGNIDRILASSLQLRETLSKHPVESIFIYSCCARKIFMGKEINCEITPLKDIAPISGFFTYGEFFHTNENNILFNETLTLLTLSETETTQKKQFSEKIKTIEQNPTLLALSHLAKEVTDELMDITLNLEEKVTEQTHELQESYEKLKSLDIMKNEFISIASHELRTPMTVIKSYSAMLLELANETLSEKQKHYLQKIQDNTEELLSLVNNMVDISKLESGDVLLSKERIKIQDFLQEIHEEFLPQAEKKSITFTCIKGKNSNTFIFSDISKLQRIFAHLLGNAFKFTPEHGKVSIKVTKDKTHIIFQIIDTGRGISKEKQQSIFESFTQAEDHLHREQGGAGLGLSIVKHLVENLNGDISLKKSSPKGSIFELRLPL